MSYMRGGNYIYKNTHGELEIYVPGGHVAIPLETFDELVLMRWAQMSPEYFAEVASRTIERYSGNVGCQELCDLAGADGFKQKMQEITELLKAEAKKATDA